MLGRTISPSGDPTVGAATRRRPGGVQWHDVSSPATYMLSVTNPNPKAFSGRIRWVPNLEIDRLGQRHEIADMGALGRCRRPSVPSTLGGRRLHRGLSLRRQPDGLHRGIRPT